MNKIITHFNKARELIAVGDSSSLRYACLELRFCIEAIVYKRLETSSDAVPLSLVNTWQPPRIIKLLSELDSYTCQEVELWLADDSKQFSFFSKQESIDSKQLAKVYQALGSYLHLPTIKQGDVPDLKVSSSIRKALRFIEPLTNNSAIVSVSDVVIFNCIECDQKIVTPKKALQNNECRIVCDNQSCKATYLVRSEHKFDLELAQAKCKKCGNDIVVTKGFVCDGYEFSCEKCDTLHEVRYTYEAKES
ncbi:TPA: hypothetical protein P0E33_004875 [Vibrio harveyi]|nr:hypothetical protein [Vibrio harveyi]HDM8182926.1 hypothetical protein [Vibrio harveyi]